MKTYRLKASIVGVQLEGNVDRPVIVRLVAGSIVTVAGPAPGSGLVNIEADGKTVTVFVADLEERSEQVQAVRKSS